MSGSSVPLNLGGLPQLNSFFWVIGFWGFCTGFVGFPVGFCVMLLDEEVLCVEFLDEAVLCVEFDLDRAVVGVPDCGCSLPCSDPSGCSNSGSSEFCGCSYSNSCSCGCSCWSTWPNPGSSINSGSLGPVPTSEMCVCL